MSEAAPRRITIAILAMGGEGGGVLADWLVDLAEHTGYLVPTTSIPGVAQRTGATNYYLELFPRAAARAAGRDPVLGLVPVPGDIDVVIASELMEAGRAIQRGLVTPDRTTLIASTHRVFAMTEKIALADGRVSSDALLDACRGASQRLVACDMAQLAEATNSVISAVLFGALAGAGALPAQRQAFEAAIRRGGVGVKDSLNAFAAGFAAAEGGAAPLAPEAPATDAPISPVAGLLVETSTFPEAAQFFMRVGVERLADYQNVDYARLYLNRLAPLLETEARYGDGSGKLIAETARELALGMTYEDTVRVAELKIRPDRFARVREEVKAEPDQIVQIAEFLHPRVQEIADTLPAALGRWLLNSGWPRWLVERFTTKGRVVKTSSIGGFLMLYMVAALKPTRPRSLRFKTEQALIESWLSTIARTAERDYALAVEIAMTRTLVKGYSDTHERGRRNFETLMALVPDLTGVPGAAATLAKLRKAALADDTGAALSAALKQARPLPQAAE